MPEAASDPGAAVKSEKRVFHLFPFLLLFTLFLSLMLHPPASLYPGVPSLCVLSNTALEPKFLLPSLSPFSLFLIVYFDDL